MNVKARSFLKLNYLLIVVAVILLVTTFYFYSGKQSAQDDQSKLEEEVKSAEIRLIQAQKAADVTPLQQKLAELQSQLSSQTTYFPQQVPWPELGNNLVASADKHSLQLLSLTPNIGTATEKFDKREYPKSTFNLSIEGKLDDIDAFLYDLGRSPFPELRIDNLALTSAKDSDSWSAQLTLVILTQS